MSGMQSEVYHERSLLRFYAAVLGLNPQSVTWRGLDQKLKELPENGFAHPEDIRDEIEQRLGRPIVLA